MPSRRRRGPRSAADHAKPALAGLESDRSSTGCPAESRFALALLKALVVSAKESLELNIRKVEAVGG